MLVRLRSSLAEMFTTKLRDLGGAASLGRPHLSGFRRALLVGAACSAMVAPLNAQDAWEKPDPALVERARQLLERYPLIDGHNDLPSRLLDRFAGDLDAANLAEVQTELPADIPRLLEGRVGGQFWAAHPRVDPGLHSGALRMALRSLDVIHRMIDRHPELELARTADEIESIFSEGRVASLVAMEGGQAIEGSLSALRMLYDLGVRYMTITHSKTTAWADSGTDAPQHLGLAEFGEEVVREMNRLGMFVDLSHSSRETVLDVLRVTRAPVLFSHSNVCAINAHPRCVPDELLRKLAENGGVIMVNFIAGYVPPTSPEWRKRCEESAVDRCIFAGRGIHEPEWRMRRDSVAEDLKAELNDEREIALRLAEWTTDNPWPRGSVSNVADHIDHIRQVAGVDFIGIGADYYDQGGSSMAAGLEDVTTYPHLFAELLQRGYSEEDLRKIAGGNILRAMRQMEQVARDLQAEAPPAGGP